MNLEDWLQKLRSTETYQAGVYTEAEYNITRRLPTFRRSVGPVPCADADRHIIVLEVVGGAPVLVGTLTVERPSIHIHANDADRMLFVFVEMRPRSFEVSSESGTYRLADGEEVGCRVTLQWHVEDAERVWKGSEDPVAALRRKVAEAVRGFFASRTSERLIEDPALLEQDLAERVLDRGITIIQNGLEQQVSQQARVPGLRIDAVSAAIVPSALLTEHLRRLIAKVWGPGGLADRRKTDRLLDLDQTYAPYKVREVARFLDIRLLENFYSGTWPEAMAELAAAFEAKKAEYRPKDELTMIEAALTRAQRAGLDEMAITRLKDRYEDALFNSLEGIDNRSAVSDQGFLKAVLGPPQAVAQVSHDTPAPGNGEAKD